MMDTRIDQDDRERWVPELSTAAQNVALITGMTTEAFSRMLTQVMQSAQTHEWQVSFGPEDKHRIITNGWNAGTQSGICSNTPRLQRFGKVLAVDLPSAHALPLPDSSAARRDRLRRLRERFPSMAYFLVPSARLHRRIRGRRRTSEWVAPVPIVSRRGYCHCRAYYQEKRTRQQQRVTYFKNYLDE